MASQNVFSIFFPLIFIPLILAADLHDVTINEISKLHSKSVDEYIDYVNPPAVHKFQNGNGASVLCVKYEDQISLQSGNIIKPLRQWSRDTFKYNSSSVKECPEGSVPILEITPERVKRAGSVRQFLNSRSRVISAGVLADARFDHWHGIVQEIAPLKYGIHESKAVFNVWQPFVQSGDAFSLTQMWAVNRRPDNTSSETLEVGLQVDPQHYGTPRMVFFIYTTLNGYQTGCLNLECKGFIQEGKQFYPGMPLNKASVYDGTQEEVTISLKRENRGNNGVWAVYFQNTLVGHWPAANYKELALSANQVDFGGEVALLKTGEGTPFSKTDMGSGRYPTSGNKKAAYIRNIELLDAKGASITDRQRIYLAYKPKCYNVQGMLEKSAGFNDHIFYGGPGGDDPQCTK